MEAESRDPASGRASERYMSQMRLALAGAAEWPKELAFMNPALHCTKCGSDSICNCDLEESDAELRETGNSTGS